MNKKNRALSLLLVFAMALLLIPSFGITASAAHRFSGGIVIIDEDLVAAKGNEFIIEGDVFSVTVIGDVDVSIIFNNVQIDRSNDKTGTNIAGIYTAGQRLNWTRGYNSFYVPTCPLLITGGASVTARFDGNCTFKAGTSGWYATSDNINTLSLDSTNRGGYAGIQVDGDSSLTISGAQNLIAYGAYQTQNSSTSAGSGKPSGLTDTNDRGGGAGIGGGTSYTSPSAATSSYTQGTPGTIIIDNGKVTAYGGFQAAGIGGGTNSAATTNKIEINGGVVTAHGGAWAAGIGEGDSVDKAASKLFNSKENTYEVVINGGVVTAYGGYSAAAIGTTDAITNGNSFSQGTTSGLSITITGGDITATSGETSTDSLTAAIGAGQNTDMEDNSITIYNEAKIVAASFSQYAISNYGYSTGVPSVNIDPEGYVYLVRFTDIADERTFKIYAIHKNANGHFMYVQTVASDMADGTVNNAINSYYYAYDPGHIASNGKNIGSFYLVGADGANVVPADYATNPNNYIKDSNRYYPTTIPSLSAYYDVGTVIETITVPGKYKAVAITLPNPEIYGGSYVLEAPLSNNADDKMYALLEKDLPGVTSGMLSSGESVSNTHFTAGENPPSEANSTPNITIDGTAKPFTKLSVGVYNKEGVAQPSLITDFVETVYGYTIYVPNETEKFWLDFSFDTQYINEDKQNVTAKLSLLTVNGVNKLPNNVEDGSVKLTNLEFGKDDRVDIWIKKTDTAAGSTKTISYKITLIIKDKYSFLLNLEALDKVYDGIPVDPSFKALIDGETTTNTKHEVGAVTTSYTPGNATPSGNSQTVSNSDRNFSIGYKISNISINTIGTVTYTATFTYTNSGTTYTKTHDFTVDKDGNLTLNAPGYWTNIGNYSGYTARISITVTGTGTGNTLTFQLQQKNKGNWKNVKNRNVNLSISGINVTPPSEITVPDSFISDKEQELKDRIEENEVPSASQTYSYTDNTVTSTYKLTLGSFATEYEAKCESKCNVKVTVTAAGGKNYTDMMTPEEKEAVVYTFYQDIDGDGVYEKSHGTERPKNAGLYKIVATLDAAKYEAEGSVEFEISKKEIRIVAIENWLKYITNEEIKNYNGVILNPGQIYFEGVVSGETVNLLKNDDLKFSYVNLGDTTTYIDDITYNDRKIRIENPVLDAASSVNYKLIDVEGNVCYVPGQIAYSTVGAIFRKAASPNTSLWRKYYPVDELSHLSWVMNDDGITFTDPRIDYHSPVPDGANDGNKFGGGTVGIHREYVKLRTTGDTSERYSIDIEFGAMQYQYTKRVWNVNTGEYEGVEGESKWTGNNGTNNAVTVTNRSNSQIYYKVEFKIDFMYAAITEGADSGIRAALFDTNGARVAGTQVGEKITSTSGESQPQSLPAAEPGTPTTTGEARSKKFMLVLSGVPSSITEGNTLQYTNVGSITVEIIELTP